MSLQEDSNISPSPTWDGVRRLIHQQFRSLREDLIHGIEFGASDGRYRSYPHGNNRFTNVRRVHRRRRTLRPVLDLSGRVSRRLRQVMYYRIRCYTHTEEKKYICCLNSMVCSACKGVVFTVCPQGLLTQHVVHLVWMI